MKTRLMAASGVAVILLLAGCEDAAKAPAGAAINAANEALAAVKAEAAKYAPEQTKAVEDTLASAKAAFEKKEYSAALSAAKDAAAKASALSIPAMKAKDELLAGWNSLSVSLPKTSDAVQAKAKALAAAHKFPDDAAAKLKAANLAWAKATEAMTAGDAAEAMRQANQAKTQFTELAASLGLKPAPVKPPPTK